jgi:uncharacterized membrane protein YhiD involved in acid resistance
MFAATSAVLHAQLPGQAPGDASAAMGNSPWSELTSASIRLPLAALLGTMLALRPKRPGTPGRTMSVVETQIILSIVGALIMLVVGASLARAFGIVGAANLIRYRAKIEDPKDAVVMLAALSVGLACGVGLYLLAGVGTLFIGAALWFIEGFEPAARKEFELTLTVKEKAIDAADLKPRVEALLRRFHAEFELRTTAEDTVAYAVSTPATIHLDNLSVALEHLVQGTDVAVEWAEKKAKKGA